MKNNSGFTLIELIIFIVVTGILASTILLTFRSSLIKTPDVHYSVIATQLADQCMEGFIGSRDMLGYSTASLACGAATLPSICSAPSGYSISASISCSPTLSGDSTNSKTITVVVSGLANATLTTLITDY